MASLGVVGFNSGSSSVNLVVPITFFKTTEVGDSFFNALSLNEDPFKFFNFLGVKESLEQGGKAIRGITKRDSIPTPSIVRLYERSTGKLIRDAKSGADGYFEFKDLSPTIEFYVVVLDSESNSIYDAEISDHVFALEG